MTLHYKVGGVWEQVDRPYLKSGNIWKPVNEVWVKDGGVWVQSYEYDILPPDPPSISIEIVETVYWEMESGENQRKVGRHLKIGVRTPGIAHDEDLKWIRVLTNQADGSPPSTQFGARYVTRKQDGYPDEPWSDFSYNEYNGSKATKDSSVYHYKTWPPNATNDTQLEPKTYYFTGWSVDQSQNWSAATQASVVVPKKVLDGTDVKIKEARFQANRGGTLSTEGVTLGDLEQKNKPIRRGIWIYGHQFTENIGQQGPATIKSAQIFVHRRNDAGEAQANIYLWWHDYPSVDDIPDWDDIERHQITKLGTIGKGESKWFSIPDAHRTNIIAGNVKGFGLNQKASDSVTATAADYSVLKSVEEALRSGEVHVTWTEKLN